jgi:hypothetical protein
MPSTDEIPKIKKITKLYYSNPKIQEVIFKFAKDREVVPRYYEGFGKRPDTLQYPSDVFGLVSKGATSFHASEEIWKNPLEINSEMTSEEFSELRKNWDLLIDIDSPYLDYSKIAAKLILEVLEKHGVRNYGLKFSGKKGFHIIVPAKAFPETHEGIKTSTMFPEWPRAISEYLMAEIKPKYNKTVTALEIDFKALQERTNLSKEEVTESLCPNCKIESKKGLIINFNCDRCKTEIIRKNHKLSKRKLKCIDDSCPGYLTPTSEKEYFYCEKCNASSFNKRTLSDKKVIYSREAKFSDSFSGDFKEEVSGEKMASLDLVLVAPRHLFRMPYSLHEKTALASIVINKEDISAFTPKDATPLNLKPKNFYPNSKAGEAKNLLTAAIAWKKIQNANEEKVTKAKYKNYEKINLKGVKITEDMFPNPIKKLQKGLKEGRKRGLFVYITFLRSLEFSPDYINNKIRKWNKKNAPPLKEGYIRSQIDWHLRQKKQILPPNYSNNNFYKDLKLLDTLPNTKNPIVEVIRKIRKQDSQQSF